MSTIYTIKESTLTAIGDAIREKTGTTTTLNPEGEMPEAILGISAEFNIERIEIATPPDKVEYTTEEVFDPTGMVVMEYYSDGSSEECFGYEYKTDELTTNDAEIIISFTWRGVTATTTQKITVSPPLNCYGVEWDGTSTTKWSRTELAEGFTDPVPYVAGATEYSSPFDNIYPWSGMVRVTDPTVGELVAIPRFWFKWTKNGDALKLQIAQEALPGFNLSPAHRDRGDGKGERDVVYIGRYLCSSSSGVNASVSGANSTLATWGDASTFSYKPDYAVNEYNYSLLVTIQMLYLVEYADWNAPSVIGAPTYNNGAVTNGVTDAMPYHTGTTASARSTAGIIQYRHIERLYGELEWIFGCGFNEYGFCVDRSIRGGNGNYKSVGGTPVNGLPKRFDISTVEDMDWVIYPTEHSYTGDTSLSGYWTFQTGKGYLSKPYYHLFGFDANSSSTTKKFRIAKYPNPS